ncbi:MAG: hypothetical protein ACLTX6_08130 [Lachnospiraceae bacterium]
MRTIRTGDCGTEMKGLMLIITSMISKMAAGLVVAEYPKREGYWNEEPRDEHFFHFLKKNKKKYASLDEVYDEKFRNETDSITSLVEFLKEIQK